MRCKLLLAVIFFMQGHVLLAAESLHPGRFDMTLVDDQAIGYATFQSHNQKVIQNSHGIFMAYIRSRNEPYTAQNWRLIRSIDGGKTFAVIHDATDATNPPVLETDLHGNVYMIRQDFLKNSAYLYIMNPTREYRDPSITMIPDAAAGKYSMVIDELRSRLYYFAHNNTFHVLDLQGRLLSSNVLIRDGSHACLQYPLMSLSRDGVLYAAWTTQKHEKYLYWDIHLMKSLDGGNTWMDLKGHVLQIPVVVDDSGPTDRITLNDEFEVHTWLSSFMVFQNKLHFIYLAQTSPSRQHYVRIDPRTGEREVDAISEFKGEKLAPKGLDGFFASGGGRIFCVHQQDGKLVCISSCDNGLSWKDVAVSDNQFNPYSINGCRHVTPDGYIIGSFTDQASGGGPSKVYFIKLKVN